MVHLLWLNQWWIQDFPLGDAEPLGGGAPTSDTGTFQSKRMQKQKNWIPLWGAGGAGGAPWIRQWVLILTVVVF